MKIGELKFHKDAFALVSEPINAPVFLDSLQQAQYEGYMAHMKALHADPEETPDETQH